MLPGGWIMCYMAPGQAEWLMKKRAGGVCVMLGRGCDRWELGIASPDAESGRRMQVPPLRKWIAPIWWGDP